MAARVDGEVVIATAGDETATGDERCCQNPSSSPLDLRKY